MKKIFVKSLMVIGVVGVVGLVGLTSVAMAVEVEWYGSIRAGVQNSDDDLPYRAYQRGRTSAGLANQRHLTADPVPERPASKAVLDLGKDKYSRIGIKASSDLGNYRRAGAQIEFSIAEAGEKSLNTRRRNVWLSGVWGKVTIGKQGGIYRSAANWDQASYLGGNVRYGGDVNNAEGITYASNGIGPFKFNVEIVGEDGLDQWAATAHYNVGLVTVNVGQHYNDKNSVPAILGTFVTLETANAGGGIVGQFDAGDQDQYDLFVTPYIDPVYNYNNLVISANSSIGNLDIYLAHEKSERKASADGTSILSTISSTIGAFVSYKTSETDKFYVEFETGETGDTTDEKTAILLGYSHGLGMGMTFSGEYVQIDKNEDGTVTKPKTLALVLKYDF